MSTRLWRRWRKDAPCVSPPDSEDRAQMEEPSENAAATDAEKANLVVRQIDRWIASMERLRLADYVRYVDDRKRLFWTSFFSGVARGVGHGGGLYHSGRHSGDYPAGSGAPQPAADRGYAGTDRLRRGAKTTGIRGTR